MRFFHHAYIVYVTIETALEWLITEAGWTNWPNHSVFLVDLCPFEGYAPVDINVYHKDFPFRFISIGHSYISSPDAIVSNSPIFVFSGPEQQAK